MSIYGPFCYARNWSTGYILGYVKDWLIRVVSFDDRPGVFNGTVYVSGSLEPLEGLDGAETPPPKLIGIA